MMRFVSWNVAARVAVLDQQVDLIQAQEPDIVCLQEVLPSAVARHRQALSRMSLCDIEDSTQLAEAAGRHTGELIASRWPLKLLPAGDFLIPYAERVVSALVTSPWGPIEVHNAHIPDGSNYGIGKIQTMAGIYYRLRQPGEWPRRILCGDFNTPQAERLDGTVITWGQTIYADGTVAPPPNGGDWDIEERRILVGLSKFNLPDVYRKVNGYQKEDYSLYYWRDGAVVSRRRFDHLFASAGLNPIECRYVRPWEYNEISDHALLVAVFDPDSGTAQ